MAKIVPSDKGFLILEVSNIEAVSILGGLGICDACNNASNKGNLISVLAGRWYCPECYQRWHGEAINYEEDRAYEKSTFDKYAKALSVIVD